MKRFGKLAVLSGLVMACTGCAVGSGVSGYALEARRLSPAGEERILDRSFEQMHTWVENRLTHERRIEQEKRQEEFANYLLNLEMQDLEKI